MKGNFDNSSPIFMQIVEQMLGEIASGKLAPGQKVEAVRTMALEYKVNPNTMQKSLEKLGDMGFLYTERTSGRFVTTDTQKISELCQKIPKEITERFVKEMLDFGVKDDEIIGFVEKTLKERNDA